MKMNLLRIVITSAIVALPIASFAQRSGDTAGNGGYQSAAPDPAAPAGSMENRYGQSPRCEAMNGADKEQCLRDEAQKTEGSQPDAKAGNSSAGSGSTSPSAPAADSVTSKSPTQSAPADSGSAGTGTR
jgi:hypothetical protein